MDKFTVWCINSKNNVLPVIGYSKIDFAISMGKYLIKSESEYNFSLVIDDSDNVVWRSSDDIINWCKEGF